jgi:hypothetical protein
MAEATIDALSNLVTATATYRGVVANHSNRLKEVKALMKRLELK